MRNKIDYEALPVKRICPPGRFLEIPWREIWEERELLFFLIWRNLKIRYKQTLLGASWTVLQPLLTMAAFTIVFGRLVKVSSDGIPYPLFALAGLIPWTYFSNALSQASMSLVENEKMLTKIYFPRLLIPLSSVLSGWIDFAIMLLTLLVIMLVFGRVPGITILLIPGLALLATAAAFGVGLGLSALNVQYRDVRQAVIFFIQFWLFATPVAYPASLIPGPWRILYGLNPIAGVVEGFRWALYYQTPFPGVLLLTSLLSTLFLLVAGLSYFSRMEASFADII